MHYKCKHKKAQHIIELALLAPFIIFFIGIVAEIAIIINANYKFNSSLYEAINLMALTNKINIEKEETVKNIKEYAKILLKQRRVPYVNSLELKLTETDNIDFLIGTYQYRATFTPFNSKGEFTPDYYGFLTIIPVNSAILRKNSFNIPNTFFDTPLQVKSLSDNSENTQETDNGNDNDYNVQDFEVELE